MSSVRDAYNEWSKTYDEVENRTRDLDRKAMQQTLQSLSFDQALEFGCGTGKNTMWLSGKAKQVVAADFSEGMLSVAKTKVQQENVRFVHADISQPWPFDEDAFDLVCMNLVLEHVADLDFVYAEAKRVLKKDGLLFISELHPFKQYAGSKARFENNNETVVLECFTHHISEFLSAHGSFFELVDLSEWFDEDNKQLPRILSLLFKKR
jgi:ubiquinone/menaquinone biosynthesis C-methylase UbiE